MVIQDMESYDQEATALLKNPALGIRQVEEGRVFLLRM